MGGRRIKAAGLLVLLTALGVVLWDRDPTTAPDALRVDDEGVPAPGTLLTASGSRDPAPPAPALAMRPDPADDLRRPAAGPVTVRVLGPDGTPLESVHVGLVASSNTNARSMHAAPPRDGVVLETDDGGEAVFASVPFDGSRAVLVWPRPLGAANEKERLLPPAPGRPPFVRVRGPDVVYRAGVGLWLEVLPVDADTGRRVRRTVTSMDGARRMDTEVAESRRYLMMLDVENPVKVALRVQAPAGWVAWEPSVWSARISPYARRLRAFYPLRREVPVSVSVLETDGAPVRAPVVRRVDVAGRHIAKPSLRADAYGRLHLAGVPLLPGEILRVSAARARGLASGTAHERIPETAGQGVHLEVVVPPEDPRAIGIGGGVGGVFRGRGGSRTLLASGGGGPVPKGSASVHVRRRDGSPAAGAKVKMGARVQRADAAGIARFDRVPPGAHAVTVRQVGLHPLSGTITVAGEEEARLVLREGKGGRLRVQVTDEEGQPLPFATLGVKPSSGHPWVDYHGDVQRIDPFVDREGRRTLHGLEPGSVVVSASWGARRATVTVKADEGGEHPVHLVLPRPKD